MTVSVDALRGHNLIPADDVLSSWPDLYATERTRIADKVVYAHFFVGCCNWWLVELDQEDNRLSFGYVCLGDPQLAEWGYFDLGELAEVMVQHPAGLRLVVERDLHWTPTRFAEIKEAQR